MRIEALSTLVAVVWLTAVLCPRLTAANNLTLSYSRKPRKHLLKEHNISNWTEPLQDPMNRWMKARDIYMFLRQEAGEEGKPIECCPTSTEMVEPVGGRNQENMYVALYRDGANVQRFFEHSCKPEVLDKPCRFIDRRVSNRSRCVQKFSFTYAIVETPLPKIKMEKHGRHHHHKGHHYLPAFPGNTVSGSGWTLDYIKVRSGCSCEIEVRPRKKKVEEEASKKKKIEEEAQKKKKITSQSISRQSVRRVKSKQHQSRDQESDSET